MNKTILLSFTLFFYTLIALSQSNQSTIVIDYTYHTNVASDYKVNSQLTTNGNQSLFEIDHIGRLGNEKIENFNGGNSLAVQSKGNNFVFKNFIENTIHYEENINFKFHHITSKLDTLLTWELKNEFKNILGYKCQMAATSYGGRYYIAYFTTDFPVFISDGPWRFQGLPGMILEVRSTDNVLVIEATSISEIKTPLKIINPLATERSMPWKDFLVLYQKQYDATLRNSMTDYGSSQSLPKRNIVTYIEEK